MIEEINSIKNQNTFKKSLFRGTIFKFSNSKNALKIVDTIKKEVQNYYSNNLESLHLEKDAELISKELISKLKNQDQLLNLFEDFLKEINFEIKDCYRDKFVVRIAPAEFKKATYETSRIGIHRDTWGTNIFEQVNWWAPINNLDQKENMVKFRMNRPYKARFGDDKEVYGVTIKEYEKLWSVFHNHLANHLGFNYNERTKDDWRVITIRKK